MPIYEYRCGECGHQKEVLQRISDAPLTDCPECGKRAFNKMVTAAGFQLKGTGWYATDFKNSGSKPAAKSSSPAAKSDSPAAKADKPAESAKSGESASSTDGVSKDSAKSDAAASSAGTCSA